MSLNPPLQNKADYYSSASKREQLAFCWYFTFPDIAHNFRCNNQIGRIKPLFMSETGDAAKWSRCVLILMWCRNKTIVQLHEKKHICDLFVMFGQMDSCYYLCYYLSQCARLTSRCLLSWEAPVEHSTGRNLYRLKARFLCGHTIAPHKLVYGRTGHRGHKIKINQIRVRSANFKLHIKTQCQLILTWSVSHKCCFRGWVCWVCICCFYCEEEGSKIYENNIYSI